MILPTPETVIAQIREEETVEIGMLARRMHCTVDEALKLLSGLVADGIVQVHVRRQKAKAA